MFNELDHPGDLFFSRKDHRSSSQEFGAEEDTSPPMPILGSGERALTVE